MFPCEMARYIAGFQPEARKYGRFFDLPDQRFRAAAGQIPADEMDTVYGVKAINSQTKVYGLIGGDVIHSLSPAIHNRGFKERGIDYLAPALSFSF